LHKFKQLTHIASVLGESGTSSLPHSKCDSRYTKQVPISIAYSTQTVAFKTLGTPAFFGLLSMRKLNLMALPDNNLYKNK